MSPLPCVSVAPFIRVASIPANECYTLLAEGLKLILRLEIEKGATVLSIIL